MNIPNILRQASEFYASGNKIRALELCKKILQKRSDNASSLHLAGLIYYELRDYEQSIRLLKKTVQLIPENANAHTNLGNALKESEQFEEAEKCYRKAIEINPQHAMAYNNLGSILQMKGNIDEAIRLYQKAIIYDPKLAFAYNNLGTALMEKNKVDEAILNFQKAIQNNPNYADAHYNLGSAYQEKQKYELAIKYLRNTLKLNPEHPQAHLNLSFCLMHKDEIDEAIAFCNKYIKANPEKVDGFMLSGILHTKNGDKKQAMKAFQEALRINPDSFSAKWSHCLSNLQIIYSSVEEIFESRNNYEKELLEIRESLASVIKQNLINAAEVIGSVQPFYLPYQGMNDRDLQKIYGDIVNTVMLYRYPQFSELKNIPDFKEGEKIRVGIVSGYFYRHSNWKIPIKGWVENLDKNKFELYAYYTGDTTDNETETSRKSFTKFYEEIYNIENLSFLIRSDNLHVLIYPEIGMNPFSARLASLRLAPVQCTSWGHPETSGFSTIDYYLSSDLMEPPEADNYYTEKLIRLPNLSIHYTPLDIPSTDISRKTYGLKDDVILYLCSQSLFKYLPYEDEVYPLIAKEFENCQFVFIVNNSRHVTEIFRERLNNAFQKHGLEMEKYVVFLPRLDSILYKGINKVCDVFLDSIRWSGCNSTFEALEWNLPVVTLPGNLMRGRHSYAILKMLGLDETIASSLEEYVSISAKLGKDKDFRKYVSEKIASNKYRIYRDMEPVKALEDFLIQAVKEKCS